MATSPTQNSLKRLRAEGWEAAVVEKWNAHAGVRIDLFGFIDVLAINPVTGEVLAIQATSSANTSARRKKILASPNLPAVQAAGWRIEVWGWKKTGRYWGCDQFALHGDQWMRMA